MTIPVTKVGMVQKILRSSTTKAVNLPPEIWKEAGWKLNDEVEVIICEMHTCNKDDDRWNSISIERIKDLEKYEEDYRKD